MRALWLVKFLWFHRKGYFFDNRNERYDTGLSLGVILFVQSVHYLVFMLYLCAQMRKWAAPRHSQMNLLQLSACTVFCKVIIEDE